MKGLVEREGHNLKVFQNGVMRIFGPKRKLLLLLLLLLLIMVAGIA
jgi:hypothetical protein